MASRKESCTRFKKQKLIIYRFPPKVNRNMARAIAERRTTLSLIQFTRKMFCMENGTNQNTDMAKKKWKGVFIRRRGVNFCSELQPVSLKNIEIEFS